MDLTQLISGQLGNGDLLGKLGQAVGADKTQVEKAMQLGMPAILKALGGNAATPDGAAALSKALDNHQDDDVDDAGDFLFGKIDLTDASKMVGHIFSGKQDQVAGRLAKQSGLDASQASELPGPPRSHAPRGALGKQKKTQEVDASGLGGMLGGLLGQPAAPRGLASCWTRTVTAMSWTTCRACSAGSSRNDHS